ncbi:MAG TPA: YfhD family protein [Bacillus sp. (in: firmicutes)]|nr:YfhD family protein [Bacillus sp. (in: firmicutes)]
MGRSRGGKSRDKNKATLPQVPKNLKSDGYDVEFSMEHADNEDLEALARAQAAGARVRQRHQNKK